MTTVRVYTLNGLIPTVLPISTLLPRRWLGGQLFDTPFTRRDIRYKNWAPVRAWAEEAADKLITEARKPGPKIFLGQSEGAEVCCIALRDGVGGADPEDNVFVLTGNPERKYGGMLLAPNGVRPPWAKPAYGGIGFPADTPFRVWDVARQYDRFADFPTVNVKEALDNNAAGGSLHINYTGVRVGDPANLKIKEGNVTYELQPTFPMPKCRKEYQGIDRQALEDAKIRDTVEKGYTRPSGLKVPKQTIARFEDGGGYDVVNRRPVRVQSGQPIWNPFS